MNRLSRPVVIGLALAVSGSALAAPPASALNPLCGSAGVLTAPVARACAGGGGSIVTAGKQLITGNVGGAVQTVVGGAVQTVAGSAASSLASGASGIALAATGAWVLGSAQPVLNDTAAALGATTSPQLGASWFSSTYWRMAAIASVLTLPFLFAAAVQALIRSELALLVRAAFGYLPLAMLAIAIAAPLTTLLLAASDELCTWISSAASGESARFLARAGAVASGLGAAAGSPFLAFLIGLFIIGAAFALWIELLLREAAVYVIVLMLPLAFAALVWPTRRIWAVRAMEILMALILSKFAIVAVLSLGGAAIDAGTGHGGVAELMAGGVLILLAAFSPWALMRLVPMAEIAAGAAGSLRTDLRPAGATADKSLGLAIKGDEALTRLAARLADDGGRGDDGGRLADDGGRADDAGRAADAREAPGSPAARSEAPIDPGGGPDAASPTAEAEAPEPPERPWSEHRTLELGSNFAGTPVFPHPDAE